MIDILDISELGLSSMLYDMFSNPFLQTWLVAGSIGYVGFLMGKSSKEKTIEKTLDYLIKEGYLHTDKDGDIKVVKK